MTKRDINSFLRPLVSELLELWKGLMYMDIQPPTKLDVLYYVFHGTCQLPKKFVAFLAKWLILVVRSVIITCYI